MKPTRSVLITGGTTNIGYQAALNIAKTHPEYLVVIASRTDGDGAAQRINTTLKQDNTVYLPLDLCDTDNVRRFAETWASKEYPPLQALILNAALQFPGAIQTSPQGIEKTFAISHVGHALLFHLLVPHLASNARVVVTSSGTHDPARRTGLPDAVYTSAEELAHPPPATQKNQGQQRYTTAKLCNVLWTYAVHTRLSESSSEKRITINAMCPGLVPGTGLAREATWFRRFLWTHILTRIIPLIRMLLFKNTHTPQESGAALARLAVGSEFEGVSGKYFQGTEESKSSEDSYDPVKQDDLWEWTVNHLSQGKAEEKARFQEFR